MTERSVPRSSPSPLPHRPTAPLLLRAGWAFPVVAPPFENAALLIGPDGRIEAVGPAAGIPAREGIEVLDLGDAILLPGLVNTHTHLELTGFERTSEEGAFPEWIQDIRRLKQARSPAETADAARAGLRDCWAAGVTTIADTGDSGTVLRALAELGGSGIAYQEVFGPHPSQLEESFAGLLDRMRALRQYAGGRVQLGVSPHAPYTVSGPLFARVAEWARQEDLPLAVHIAESKAETDFVTRGSGPFAQAWKARGIPLLGDPAHYSPSSHLAPRTTPLTPISWLQSHRVLGPRCLCIHAVQLADGDIGLLKDAGAGVAHCPLSNARHGHGSAPLAAFRSAGVPVGVGTDSVASVGRLDLFAEMRAAQTLGGLSEPEALALGTIDAARALGLEGEIGSLTPGKWGDVIAVRPHLPPPTSHLSPRDVLLTVIAGRIVHSTVT